MGSKNGRRKKDYVTAGGEVIAGLGRRKNGRWFVTDNPSVIIASSTCGEEDAIKKHREYLTNKEISHPKDTTDHNADSGPFSNEAKDSATVDHPQIPNELGLAADALKARIGEFEIPHVTSVRDAVSTYETLAQFDIALSLFDFTHGEIAWLKGTFLNSLKPITPGEKGILKKGEWTVFLSKFFISNSTAENYRHIANRFSRTEARDLGYAEMVNICASEKRLKKGESNKNEIGTDKAENPGGDDSPILSMEKAVKTLRLADIPKNLTRIIDSISFMKDQMPNAADLFKNPNGSKDLLTSYGEKIDQIRNYLNAFEAATLATHAKVQDYINKGQALGMKVSGEAA